MSPLDLLINSLKQPKRPGFDPDFMNDESIDPSVRADAGAGAMEGELSDRIFQAERTQQNPNGPYSPTATSPFEVKALQNLLGRTSAQRNDPRAPLNQQWNDLQLNDAAQQEGFEGGNGMSALQQRNIYKRNQEQEKMRQPVQIANINNEGAFSRQAAQNAATLKQVEMQMGPANKQADINEKYNDALLQGGMNTDGFKGMNKYGPQFSPQHQTPINPNVMNKNLADARMYLGQRGNANPFATMGAPDRDQAFFDQTVRNLITSSGVHPETQDEIFRVLQDPQEVELPVEALIQRNNYDTTDEDFVKFAAILKQLRGK